MAGVAQTHIYRRFAWQAWHLWYWVAPLGRDLAPVTPRHFAWQAWHNLTSTFVSRGRRGTISHPPSFCVAGVALMALGGALGLIWSPVTPRHFAWQAWHKLTSKPLSCQMVFSNLVGVFTLVYILKNLVPYTSYLCILHSHHTSSCLVMSNSTCHKSSPPALTFPTILHHIIILGLVFCMFLKEHHSQYYFVSTNHY